MVLAIFLVIVFLSCAFGLAYKAQVSEERRVAAMPAEDGAKYRRERAEYWHNREVSLQDQKAEAEHGPLNRVFVCPHCQSKGKVRTKAVKRKKGISGGKATAALITGGISVLATGLSRKENLTQAHCESCNSTWLF